MAYDVQIRDVDSAPIAVVAGRATGSDLARKISSLLSTVRESLKKRHVEDVGLNVVLYNRESETDEGFSIEVGVQIATPLDADGDVVCSSTPAGKVATVVHRGPYEQIPQAHKALLRWCRENGHTTAGLNWEVYGHWSEEPDQRRTEVFYLFQDYSILRRE
jgi:effector-binding domain-containing protein